MLLIGSTVLKYHAVSNCVPSDTDFVCTQEEALVYAEVNNIAFSKFTDTKAVGKNIAGIFEFNFINDSCTNPYKLMYDIAMPCSFCITTQPEYEIYVPSVEFILAVKYSHRFADLSANNFYKTRQDILYLESIGYSPMKHPDFDRIEKLFCNKHPKLNVKAADFFKETDGFYVYQHDDIHSSIVSPDFTAANAKQPAYKLIIDGEVQCSKEKWDKLTFEQKVDCAIEECFVLALERSIIPFRSDTLDTVTRTRCLYTAFDTAIRKVSTRITSGYFREFCWKHLDEITDEAENRIQEYYSNFLTNLKAGRIRKFGTKGE